MGRERRVYFRVAAHARPYFAASQIKYLQGQIESSKRAKVEAIPSKKAALERVKNNHKIVEGAVKLVETSKGWVVDDKSYNFYRLWEWFYDR